MYIEKKSLPLEILKEIKKHLTIREFSYTGDDIVYTHYFYETEDNIFIPRHFLDFFNNIKLAIKNNVIEETKLNGKKIDIKYKDKFEYRKGQYYFVKQSLLSNECIIKRPPGKGKTIIGAGIIVERKVKTLIVVNMITLIKQWCEAIDIVCDGNFTININEIFSNKNDDIYIVTIQSLLSFINKNGIDEFKKYIKKLGIGLVIFDEVHLLVGPDKFTNTLFGLVSKYWVALSATPFKENERDKILLYWFGNNLIGSNDYDIIPKINIIRYNSNLKPGKLYDKNGNKIKNPWYYINWGNKFYRDRYFKYLFKKNSFIELITSLCYKVYKQNRKTLLLTHFNKGGIKDLYSKIKENKIFKEGDIDLFIESDSDIKRLYNKKLIFSNYKKFSTGVNVPTIDTIIMITPLTKQYELEQTIGRSLRLLEGKNEVIVYDIYDIGFISRTKKWLQTRIKFYKDMGFEVIEN